MTEEQVLTFFKRMKKEQSEVGVHHLLRDVHSTAVSHGRAELDHLLQPDLQLVQIGLVLVELGPEPRRVDQTFRKTDHWPHFCLF